MYTIIFLINTNIHLNMLEDTLYFVIKNKFNMYGHIQHLKGRSSSELVLTFKFLSS